MTTAIVDAPQALDTAKDPVTADLGSIFYNQPAALPNVETPVPPTTASTTGTPATPPASAVSTDPAKTAPVGTEKVDVPKADDPPKDPDKGHAAAARRLGSEVVELKRETQALLEANRVLTAKLEGTYKEPAQPTPEEIAARAEFKGRETSSRSIAETQYGVAKIQSEIYDDDSPYKTLVTEKPWLHARVSRHAQPAVEAMRVLQEESFREKYGDDPAQWVTKIEAELTPRIEDIFKKQVAIPLTGDKAPSLTEVRGTNGNTPAPKSLAELFYGTPPA